MAAQGFQVIEGVDVVKSVSVERLGDPGGGGGGVGIKDASEDPHDGQLAVGAHLRDQEGCKLFTKRVGDLC